MTKISKDKQLLSKVKKRDKDAFIEAYDLYVDDIYRFIYFKVGSKEEAEDLASTVFLKTWNYIQNQNLKSTKTLRALIYKIARNAIIDYYRKNRPEETIINDDELGIDIEDENQDIHKQVEINSDIRIVEAHLAKLKDEYREVIIMRYVDELSITEIASVTGKSKGNIRVLSYRALQSLKELLNS